MVKAIDWEAKQLAYEIKRLEWNLDYWRGLTPKQIRDAHSHGKPVPEAITEIKQQIAEKRRNLQCR
jgi:hypothetical protein